MASISQSEGSFLGAPAHAQAQQARFIPPSAPSVVELGAACDQLGPWIFHHFAGAILIGSTQLLDAELGQFAGLEAAGSLGAAAGLEAASMSGR